MDKNQIERILPFQTYFIFYKNKRIEVLDSKTIPAMSKALKKYIQPPKTNKKAQVRCFRKLLRDKILRALSYIHLPRL